MYKFLDNNSEHFLLDPFLFKEHFSFIRKIIPVYMNNNKLFVFTRNNETCSRSNLELVQKEIDQDLLNEKIYLIKNYHKLQETKNFKESPIRSIIEFILIEALLNKVSDIHFNIYSEEKYIVRFKKDTVLYDFCELNKSQFDSIILCFKILSELDTSKRHLPQSSSFYKIFRGEIVDFRFSTHPTFLGERFVIRLLSKKNVFHYKDMNLDQDVLNTIEKVIDYPNGLVLFTGPTNSGKTTLIHSIISEISKKNLIIMTLEDPVEYRVPGIIQTNITENGLSFYEGMRSILRQDPDVIFLGEIRDSETAKIAIQAALTGHKVLATLHAYSTKGTVKRLLDMGISNVMLAECLVSVFSQRLVRKTDIDGKITGLNLLVDSIFFDQKLKNCILENDLDQIIDNLRKNAQFLIDKGIINKDELKRVLG